MNPIRHALMVPAVAALLGLGSLPSFAETVVADAWVRATVAQQRATGLFAKITSTTGGKLVGASSPAAGVTEVHEMSMDGNTMRMRAVQGGLELPAGQTVELKPGGFHIMLMDLKQQVKEGETVTVTLDIQGPDGKTEQVLVQAPAKALSMGKHGMHKH